jgi:hypothetical protein
MKTDTLRFRDLLQKDIRLIVPLFQRPYVWNQRDQWTPFWEDIRAIAEDLLLDRFRRPHFLGAIVLEQVPTRAGEVDQRLIIDGQQRLTTTQILLEAFHDLCYELGAHKHQSALSKMTRIDDPMVVSATELYKVWPTTVDQPAFRLIMECKTQEEVETAVMNDRDLALRPIVQGYLYFSKTLREWITDGAQSVDMRISALLNTLRDHMRFVVIDLESEDDSQLIFETLNARGTPLLPTDLVKNFIFHRARLEGYQLASLYARYWQYFDDSDDWWRKQVGRGHAQRARIDLFLQAFLTIKTKSEVPVTHVYAVCRDHLIQTDSNSEGFLKDLNVYGSIYCGDLSKPEKGSDEERFIKALDVLDVLSVTPVAMELFRCLQKKPKVLRSALRDIESFLIRRTICGLNTRGYNRFFVDMLELISESEKTADRIRAYLLKSDSESSRWPNDREFRDAWLHTPMYKTLARKRVRFILENLERATHGSKTEQFVGTLQIEHLIPQNWRQHWPLPGEEEEEIEAAYRNRALHTVGNLTLATSSLNPAISNGPWLHKQKQILKFSALNLNRELSEEDTWDELAITRRARSLFKAAQRLWAYPKD